MITTGLQGPEQGGDGPLVRTRLSSGLGALGVAVVLAGAMAPAPAYAFNFFGLKLFEDQSETDADAVIADPQPYTLSLSVNTADKSIESLVRNASTLAADEAEPASGAAGLIAKARGDYNRIVTALYGEGYYGGVVNIRIGNREVATLPPDTNLPDPVAVTVNVDPGPLFHFNRVTVLNQAPPTSDPADYVKPPLAIGYGAGEVAKSTVVLKAEQLAIQAWQQQGYAKAAVATRNVVADHRTNTVDATITVNPGAKAAFGTVTVSGTERMNPEFVRWETGIVAGQEYDPDALEAAQKRLDRLEVFRSARLTPADMINADGTLPFGLLVQELPGRRFGAGATYSTVDGLGLEGFHLWRNLFGQAERLRLDARVASIAYPINTAQFDYFFGGTFTKPGIFTPDTDLIASVSAERTVVPAYTETSATGRVGLSQIFSDQLTAEGGLTFERNRFEDGFGIRDFSTAGVYANATFDARDDKTDAKQGFYVNAQISPFYEFYYAKPAVQAIVEGRAYFGFGEDDQFVLAGRLKGGVLLGPALNEIAPDKLFFAGGGGSVRGYGFRSIGVDNGGGVVTGGRYLLEASVEARAKVTDDIGVVGFVDGGYVAADTFPGLQDLRLGAGVGVRYYTGFGPLRADIAVPLNKRSGDPDYAIYLGLGQAF